MNIQHANRKHTLPFCGVSAVLPILFSLLIVSFIFQNLFDTTPAYWRKNSETDKKQGARLTGLLCLCKKLFKTKHTKQRT